MADSLAALRAELIASADAPKSSGAKSAFSRVLTADEVGYGRPTQDQLIAQGNRAHAELEARYGAGSEA